MNTRRQGFTIIETVLVLAITGLLLAVILATIGNSLNQQRYTDSVNQTLDHFRGLYTDTSSTQNDRTAAQACSASGLSTVSDGGEGSTSRGASDCLLVGNVMRSADGVTLRSYQVVALHDPTDDTGIAKKSDVQILTSAQLRQGQQTETYEVEWGGTLLRPGTSPSVPAPFSILVVRTPVTGVVRTFTSDSDQTPVTSLINQASAERRLCIDQTATYGFSIRPMGVSIAKDATNSSGVQVITSGDC